MMNPLTFLRACAYLVRFWTRLKPYAFDEHSVDVSMTTHGTRIFGLPAAIESIVSGMQRPSSITVAIDNEEILTGSKQRVLKQLERLGITVLFGPRIGPHAKYYHFLCKRWKEGTPFVVMDDDILYRKDILFSLVRAGRERPSHNICTRSLLITANGTSMRKYSEWAINRRSGARKDIFATNVGGVYVCAAFAQRLREQGSEFRDKCPKADDVWFKWVSLRHALPYYQCLDEFYAPAVIPFTQGAALFKSNMVEGNDAQIALTFSDQDVQLVTSNP
jgi:hypothetical protein